MFKQTNAQQVIPPDAAGYRATFVPFPGRCSLAGWVSRLIGRAGEFRVSGKLNLI